MLTTITIESYNVMCNRLLINVIFVSLASEGCYYLNPKMWWCNAMDCSISCYFLWHEFIFSYYSNFTFRKYVQHSKVEWFKLLDWHDQVLIALECLDLKLCLQINVPSQPTNTSTLVEKVLYESRKHFNNLSMMIIYSKEHS